MEVSTRGYPFIAAHKPTMGVTGSHSLPPEVVVRSPVGRPLTALQCSRPTLGNSLPPIPVEAFPCRGPLDVDGLFQQEFLRSPGPVDHRCVLPVDGVVASPGVLSNHRLLQRLGSACILVLPAEWLPWCLHPVLPQSTLTRKPPRVPIRGRGQTTLGGSILHCGGQREHHTGMPEVWHEGGF